MEENLRRRAIDVGFTRRNRLRAIYVALSMSLCICVIAAVLLRGRDAVAALGWGLQDIVQPVTAELKYGQKVNYGVYDFDQRRPFSRAKGVAIEHIFVSWLASNLDSTIKSSFSYATERNRWLMVTIEPFPEKWQNSSNLLEDTVNGAYDARISEACQSIGSLDSAVFVRWGHEMETGDGRYPWSGTNAESYVAAYRYFSARCRALAPKILLVWSPRGDANLAGYYPGSADVDFVGLSLYALPSFERNYFGRVMTFRDSFAPRYHRAVVFGKPIMIAEMGVSGDSKYQASWMQGFFRDLRHFPWLRTAVYFNAKDSPGAWPEQYGIPDWRIEASVFD